MLSTEGSIKRKHVPFPVFNSKIFVQKSEIIPGEQIKGTIQVDLNKKRARCVYVERTKREFDIV